MRILLFCRQQKTRYIAVTGCFNLKPGNVVVPTAVVSHSEMLHYRWPGLAFELFCFTTELGMGSWLFIKPQTAKNP
ncbi:hypothetical protein, partial [Pseudoalteromonas carrageenovora]|uniref:hypothetical protein n=1 Tax=Pseudoalteromonas carrageenovora TaxID=227 RepID=UPI001C3FEBE9